MLLKNATMHDGLGHVQQMDVRVEDGKITEIASGLPGEGLDLTGCHLLPGFVDAIGVWGINGSQTEIKPSSNDNDERSDPVTPELDVTYAFNGRACSVQQLPAFGITSVCVAPTDNNVFGGQMAVFTTQGVNPFRMCLKAQMGMKASVSQEVRNAYGKRNLSPMTRMRIFQLLSSNLRSAEAYTPDKEGTPHDEKLAALQKVIQGEMPLFITCDNAEDRRRVMEIIAPYAKIKVVFTSTYHLEESDCELDASKVAFINGFISMDCDPRTYNKNYPVLLQMMEKGIPVALSAMSTGMYGRECLLWEGMEMVKHGCNTEKALSMMTSTTAKILGLENSLGSIEVGKRADLVIWSANPLESFQAKVVRAMIAGETVYQKGDAMKCYI